VPEIGALSLMSGMGNGALALCPKPSRPSSTLPSRLPPTTWPKIWPLAVFFLGDPSAGLVQLNTLKRPAGSMGFRLHVIEVKSANDIEQAFAARKGPR
jgi:hypothetical protein